MRNRGIQELFVGLALLVSVSTAAATVVEEMREALATPTSAQPAPPPDAAPETPAPGQELDLRV